MKPKRTLPGSAPIGDPETVAEKLVAEIRSVGPAHMALYMTIGAADHAKVLRSIERFGTEVVPLIERALGPLAEISGPTAGE